MHQKVLSEVRTPYPPWIRASISWVSSIVFLLSWIVWCSMVMSLPGPKVIQLFSCSTQMSTKFILLINIKMPTIAGILTFISMINAIHERLKERNVFIYWYFSFYEQFKVRAHLSWARSKFYNLEAWSYSLFSHCVSHKSVGVFFISFFLFLLKWQHCLEIRSIEKCCRSVVLWFGCWICYFPRRKYEHWTANRHDYQAGIIMWQVSTEKRIYTPDIVSSWNQWAILCNWGYIFSWIMNNVDSLSSCSWYIHLFQTKYSTFSCGLTICLQMLTIYLVKCL